MKEYADFLGSQPPYDSLGSDDLRRLVEALEVEYVAAGSMIVVADQPPLDHMWVLRSGAVEVIDRGRVVDHLGPGDTFGHISVLTGLAPGPLQPSVVLPVRQAALAGPGRGHRGSRPAR